MPRGAPGRSPTIVTCAVHGYNALDAFSGASERISTLSNCAICGAEMNRLSQRIMPGVELRD